LIWQHIVVRDHLGVPQGSADAELAKKLRGMVGFRNIAVHEYQGLEVAVVRYILEEGVEGFQRFCRQLGTVIK